MSDRPKKMVNGEVVDCTDEDIAQMAKDKADAEANPPETQPAVPQ